MRTKIVMTMLFCCNAFALWGYSCPSCGNAMLNSDNFCQNCGRSRDEMPIKKQTPPPIRQPASQPVYRPVVRQPQPSDHSTGANAYPNVSLHRRTHWTPIKIGFGGSASLPSICYTDIVKVYGFDIEFAAFGDTLCGFGFGWCGGFQKIYGVQCSVIGQQLGYAMSNDVSYGIQLATLFNWAECDMYGIQIGLYNQNKSYMHGVQIGVVNKTKRMTGIQIGILNFIDQSPLAFFPIVNMHF